MYRLVPGLLLALCAWIPATAQDSASAPLITRNQVKLNLAGAERITRIPASTFLLLAAYIGLYVSLGGGFLIVDGVVRFQVRTFSHPFVAKAFQPAARVETMFTGTTVHATDTAAYFAAMNAQTAQSAAMK